MQDVMRSYQPHTRLTGSEDKMCKNGLILLGLALAGALAAGVIPGFSGPITPVDFETDALVQRWVDMWNDYDLSLVDELFLTDHRVSYFSSEKQGVIHGIDAVREHHRGFGFVEGGKRQGNRLRVDDVETDAFDGSAVVTGIWSFQRSGTGQEGLQRGPVTIVFVRHRGVFRIAHMHFATYLDEE